MLSEGLGGMLQQELRFLDLSATQGEEFLAAWHRLEASSAVEADSACIARQDPKRCLAEALCLERSQRMREQGATQAFVPGVRRGVEGQDLSASFGCAVVSAAGEADEGLDCAGQFRHNGGRLRGLKNLCPTLCALLDGQAREKVRGQEVRVRHLPRADVDSGDCLSVCDNSRTDVHAA